MKMALETLRGIKEIGGFEVERMIAEKEAWEKNFGEKYIYTASDNSIHFKIQDGPIKENGVNGCQVDTIIETCRIIIAGLDKKFPSDENKLAYNGLCGVLHNLGKRKLNMD